MKPLFDSEYFSFVGSSDDRILVSLPERTAMPEQLAARHAAESVPGVLRECLPKMQYPHRRHSPIANVDPF
jgi:hypothetical protein